MSLDLIYLHIQIIGATLLLVFGLIFLFDNYLTPLKGNLLVARRLLGFTFVIWSIITVLGTWLSTIAINQYAVTSGYLARFLTYGLLIEGVFSILIDNKYNIKKKLLSNILILSIYCLTLLINILLIPQETQYIIIVIATSFFAFEVIAIRARFLSHYNKVKKDTKNHQSHDLDIFAKQILNCVAGLTTIGLAAIVIPFLPKIAYFIYFILILVFTGYLIFSFNKYLRYANQRHLTTLTKVEETQNNNPNKASETIITKQYHAINNKLNSTTLFVLERELNKWVEQEGYTELGITIQSLATKLSSNRTYLSSYINTKYGLTFRDWISELRLEHSKKLLLNNKHIPAKKIAEMVGYAPGSYISAFTKSNKMSPAQWRKAHVIL